MNHGNATRNGRIAVAARFGVAAIAWMALAATARAQQPFEDDSTQMAFSVPGGAQNVNVHVCKGNALLIGVDVQHNRFLCQPVPEQLGPLFVDTKTHEGPFTNIHTCGPLGSVGSTAVMVGLSVDKNWLICTYLPPTGWVGVEGLGNNFANGPPGAQAPEPNFPKRNMHVCPDLYGQPTALQGIKVDKNEFVCVLYTVYPK
jgi:hypothetical protein